jgi:hypothetical protein
MARARASHSSEPMTQPLQGADRVRRFCRHGVQIGGRVFPIALRDSGAEIGFARKVVVEAGGFDADLFSQIAEIQTAIAMRLRAPPRRSQNTLL